MVEHTVIDLSKGSVNGHLIEHDVSQWTPNKVKEWLRRNGYKEYENFIDNGHRPVDGRALLSLTRDDLKCAPFNMTDLHEVDHLHSCIEVLRKSQLTKYMKKIEHNGIRNGFSHTPNLNVLKSNGHAFPQINTKNIDIGQFSSLTTPLLSGEDRSAGEGIVASSEQYTSEKMKTFLSLLYLMTGFVVSVVTLQFVHERVPAKDVDPPLPDIFFDIIPKRIENAFDICESVGMILMFFCGIILLFHKHRFIIARRLAFIMGTLYLYRSCTIYVTTLPVPGMHFKCAPKTGGKITVMLGRAASVLMGGGLTITGAHNLCGDYLFSGHTILIVMSYLLIYEYTPRRWWWFHWLCWLLAIVGILCILLAHDHYTVDVVIAYLLTTRLFWTYHTMCNFGVLKDSNKPNMLARAWWFPLFRYFEENVPSTNGNLPRQYEWPFSFPRFYLRSLGPVRKSQVKGV